VQTNLKKAEKVHPSSCEGIETALSYFGEDGHTMKKVLSVSLGSTTRDHSTEADFIGEHFWLSRQGTDGDFDRYVQMYRDNDGKVDAFGVGGAEGRWQRHQASPRAASDTGAPGAWI
jgi:hypothetical protein